MAALNLDINGTPYQIRDLSFICASSYGNQCYSAVCPGGSFSPSQWWTTVVLYKTQVNSALVAIASAPADVLSAVQRIALLQDIAQHHSTGVGLWNSWVSSNVFSLFGPGGGNCGTTEQYWYINVYTNMMAQITNSINQLYEQVIQGIGDVVDVSEEVADANAAIADTNQAMADAQKAVQEAQAAEFQRKMWTYLIPAVVVIIVLFLLRKRATA